MKQSLRVLLVVLLLVSGLSGCGRGAATAPPQPLRVLAVEPFLADITQNVAGDRLQVETLMPRGLDPHTFEPTPQDVAKIAASDVLMINGAGLEEWIEETLANAGGHRTVIEAAAGLPSRAPRQDEESGSGEHPLEGDPHFWLDPNNVVHYVENIRDGLIQADPEGRDVYTQNAAAYIAQLQELDRWIVEQVAQVPAERRLLVTNHESFGYFADRYGFQVVGAIVPSVSSGAAPSAQELAALVDRIRETGAPAVFLEIGVTPQLAEQLAQETGVRVVTGLYTHSPSDPAGPVPTYLEMIRYNTLAIVVALAER